MEWGRVGWGQRLARGGMTIHLCAGQHGWGSAVVTEGPHHLCLKTTETDSVLLRPLCSSQSRRAQPLPVESQDVTRGLSRTHRKEGDKCHPSRAALFSNGT